MDKAKQYKIEVGGETFVVKVTPMTEDSSAGSGKIVESIQEYAPVDMPTATERPKVSKDTKGAVTSPSVGMVVVIKVKAGDKVNSGDVVAITEAMKAQTMVYSPHSGTVEQILVNEGDTIDIDDVLMVVK